MGNHDVGKLFYVGILFLEDEEIDNLTQEKALMLLDKIGQYVVNNTSLDAEFDDLLNPNQKLGRVLMKAYIPEKYEEWKHKEDIDENMDDIWYYKLYKPFREKWGFW